MVGDDGEGVDDELVAALWLTVGPWRCVGGTGRVADRQCLRALVTRARLYSLAELDRGG